MTETIQQLTPAEIARVFALYYEAECVAGKEQERGNVSAIGCIPTDSYYKLLLTPLERITDEDAVQMSIIQYPTFDYSESTPVGMVKWGRWCVKQCIKRLEFPYQLYQFLISRGYAVPLWFGVDHWANGKTAIELGIAVEKQ
jgi:hypothetical protein